MEGAGIRHPVDGGKSSLPRGQPRTPRACEAGTTAIEFAIVAPVLLLLLGAMVETGSIIFMQMQLQFATTDAARQIRTLKVGPATIAEGQPNQKSIVQFKSAICEKFLVSNCSNSIRVDVRSDSTFAALAAGWPASLQSVGPQGPGAAYIEKYTPGPPGAPGSLIVSYDWKFEFSPLGILFGNVATYPGIRRLIGLSVYRNES